MSENPPHPSPFPPVGEAEAGQKLLNFLARRLGLPQALLHRWLRTGQIRLNGKRCKPFAIVNKGDIVRLPPFAFKLAASASPDTAELPESDVLPPLLGQWQGIWAFDKPSGLAVQGGTDVEDSLCSRLAAQYGHLAFCPAPAHRLDRDTSGIVLVGSTFPALQKLQADFREGRIAKEYLAWVAGAWLWEGQRLLRHFLSYGDRVTAHAESRFDRREGKCVVEPLRRGNGKTLLHIRLLTGRKRQLRAQLAACGYPIIGDGRYGAKGRLKLHACRVILPDGGPEFLSLPCWEGEFDVPELPGPMQIHCEA